MPVTPDQLGLLLYPNFALVKQCEVGSGGSSCAQPVAHLKKYSVAMPQQYLAPSRCLGVMAFDHSEGLTQEAKTSGTPR